MKEPKRSRAYARQQEKATRRLNAAKKKRRKVKRFPEFWVILANYQTRGGAMGTPTYSWAWSNIHEARDLWLTSEVEDHWGDWIFIFFWGGGDWIFKSVESDANSR